MFSKLASYIQESRIELKKVNWPTRQEAVRLTIIVIITSLVFAAFLGLLDILFHYLLGKFII